MRPSKLLLSLMYVAFLAGFTEHASAFYNPGTGRWISKDPIEESGGANLFSFVNNGPLNFYDPLGLVAVTDVPGIMSANSWTTGAALMNHWLSRSGVANKSTITMSWALGFPRAKAVYDEIINKKIYINEAAKKEIIKLVKKTPSSGSGPVKFGNVSGDPEILHADHIQYRPVGSISDPLDDMYAALGRFTFRVLVEGYAYNSSGKVSCGVIDKVGVYIYDSYDFTGSQHLGYWNSSTNYVGANPFKGDSLKNSDFRASGLGVDFKVFSDIKVTTLSPKEFFNEK